MGGMWNSIQASKGMEHGCTWMNLENTEWKKPDTKGFVVYHLMPVKCPEQANP